MKPTCESPYFTYVSIGFQLLMKPGVSQVAKFERPNPKCFTADKTCETWHSNIKPVKHSISIYETMVTDFETAFITFCET